MYKLFIFFSNQGRNCFSLFKSNFLYVIHDDEEAHFHDFILKFIKYTFYTKRKSLAYSGLSVLSRQNVNLKLILSAKDLYKKQLKWEHSFCILFVFSMLWRALSTNQLTLKSNTGFKRNDRVTVLKFVPWTALNKNV